MKDSLWLLILSTLSVGFLHSLAPDHWMPFAMIGRAQKWSRIRLFWITLVAGIGHVGLSILLGSVGMLLGFSLTKLKAMEGHRGEMALWLLIGFGLAYFIWGLKKAKSHHHVHLDEQKAKSRSITMWVLFAIFILGPCESLIPLMFLGYNFGWIGVVIVSVSFSFVTLIMMLAQSFLAFMGIELLPHHLLDKYSHALAGLIIALTGIFVLVIGI